MSLRRAAYVDEILRVAGYRLIGIVMVGSLNLQLEVFTGKWEEHDARERNTRTRSKGQS